MSSVCIPPLGHTIIITLIFASPNWYHGNNHYQEPLHNVSEMTKGTGKNSLRLRVQAVDIKI